METLSQHIFQERAAVARNMTPIRKRVQLSQLKIEGSDVIRVDGQPIQITEAGFNSLLKRLRIPPAFARRFSDAFGEDGLKQLLETVKSGKLGKTDLDVTLLADPSTRKVVDFLPSTAASISNDGFINFAERIINDWNLSPTHFGTDPLGGVQITALHDSHIFSIPGMNNETFRAGIAFSNTPRHGLEVIPFTERLVCSNGMVSRLSEDTYSLRTLTPEAISEFNGHMADLASVGFQSMQLIDKIRRSANVTASLIEVNSAASAIMKADKSISWERVNRYIPVDRINREYHNAGIETEELTRAQQRIANSGMTVWDVVNGLTNFASNDTMALNDWHRMGVMRTAGDLLKKPFFDREAVLSVDPFGGSAVLTTAEAALVRGE